MADPAIKRVGEGWLRRDAERISGALPPLLAEAQHLAATVVLGEHGRRRAGQGETFWQYRRAIPGDAFSSIDWRRSARSDRLYVRQTEWEAAQTVNLWVDPGQAMTYSGARNRPSKAERAALLAVALIKGCRRVRLGHHQVQRCGTIPADA